MSLVERVQARLWRSAAVQHALATPEVQKEIERIVTTALGRDMKQVRKNVVILRKKVDALSDDAATARFAALAAPESSPRVDTSQMDSVRAVLEVLELVGPRARMFLDVGCGRSGGQSILLAQRLGWRGLFVDASEGSVAALAHRLGRVEGVGVLALTVTTANVNEVAASVGAEIDLLNIDIDSDDYWVWRALAPRPRVVVIEYNAFLGHESVAVPEGAVTRDSPKGYSGATLAAMARLGAEKGYRLLGCDQMGTNAFFARDDLVDAAFEVSPEEAWRPNLDRYSVEEVPRAGEKLMARIRELGLPLAEV